MQPSLSSIFRRAAGMRRRTLVPDVNELQGGYRLRFAATPEDLVAVQRLRFEVFNVELGEGFEESYKTRLDQEAFDHVCQHVLVEEEASGRVVGTYRLQTREVAEEGLGFYAATEYEIGVLDKLLKNAVEAGRACVARDHRHRSVLHLLWRGMTAYGLWHGKYIFFGCSSLTSQDMRVAATADAWFERKGHCHPELRARALASHECALADSLSDEEIAAFRPPKLFATYLRHGASIVSEPAIDRFFGTIDFLTAVDVRRVEPRLRESITRGLPS